MFSNFGSTLWTVGVLVILFLSQQELIDAAKNTLDLDEDSRSAFSIETFAFSENGQLNIDVYNYSLYVNDVLSTDVRWGFFIRSVISKTDGPAILALERQGIVSECSLDSDTAGDDLIFELSNSQKATNRGRSLHWGAGDDHEHERNDIHFSHVFNESHIGRFDIEMIVCLPKETASSSIELTGVVSTTCFNIDSTGNRNYLPVGETYLPIFYFGISGLFAMAVVVWIYILVRRGANAIVVHYFMLVVLLFKTTSTASYAVHLWFISKLGQTLTVVGWDVVYYLFSFLNGGVMFVLILLIGSGWSYLKPKLNDRENYMLTIVIILQIVANVARIFVGESSPGSEDFLTWKDILAVVDIVCCALVLFPIIWSIHKLKGTLAAVESEERGSALDADTTEAGKSKVSSSTYDDSEEENNYGAGGGAGELAHSLQKLKQFRHFYVVVVCYIYFTRIVVYLADSTLGYKLAWLSYVGSEIATLLFYIISGYYFVPARNNPYFQIGSVDQL